MKYFTMICETAECFALSKGKPLVKHLVKKIVMVDDYCGRQIVQWLGWTSPIYHKKGGGSPNHGARQHSFHYDRRSDDRSEVRVGTCSIDSLSGKGEVCEEARKRMIGACCL